MGLDLLAGIGFVVKTNHTTRLGPDPYFIHVCGTALVTDPRYEKKYLARSDGRYEIGSAYLTISLGERYQNACYKLIAAIIEVE